jgi:hypothetical protein
VPSWNSDPGRFRHLPGLFLVLAVIVVHALILPSGGGFADGDSWLRLLRVRRLMDGGAWFDASLPELDAPFGSTLHWTRPLDFLILCLTGLFRLGLPADEALIRAGMSISPLLHAALVLALAWALVPLRGRAGGYLAGLLTLVQPAILAYGGPGHADHHILFLLITVVLLGFLARGLKGRPVFLTAAGAAAAFGVWASVEMLLMVGLVLAVLGLAWVQCMDRGGGGNRLFARGLAWGLIVALILERPPGDWWTVEYDRFSVVHVALGGLILTFWTIVGRRSEDWTREKRLAAGIVGAGLVAALWRAVFPGALAGPLVGIPPELKALMIDNVAENQALDDWGTMLAMAGGSLVALPWAGYRFLRGSRGGDRLFWGVVVLGFAVFLPLSVFWLRWSPYTGLFTAIALADLMVAGDRRLDAAMGPGGARAAIKMLLGTVVTIWPLALGVPQAEPEGPAARPDCRLDPLVRLLRSSPWSDRSRILLASANIGPELVFRTRHRAVAGLYHRSAAGVEDGIRIFSTREEGAALGLLALRRVDLILLCPDPSRDRLLRGDGSPETFYRRLSEGPLPAWVREIRPPEETGFRLFEIPRPTRP